MNSNWPEAEIIAGCVRGVHAYQYALYNKYIKSMYNLACRMCGDDAIAQEVTQNAFIDIFNKIEQYRGESSLGSWIKKIVINHSVSYLRKRKVVFVDYDTYAQEEVYITQEDTTSEPKYTIQTLNEAIEKLPDGYRQIFTLYALEGYDHSEISQILSVSESNSKSQYSRAKMRLRDILTGSIDQ